MNRRVSTTVQRWTHLGGEGSPIELTMRRFGVIAVESSTGPIDDALCARRGGVRSLTDGADEVPDAG